MKVLIISHSDLGGGANIAAFRLHQGLREQGIESHMLVREKWSDDPFVVKLAQPEEESWIRPLNKHIAERARLGVNNTYLSLPWPGVDVSAHPLVRDAHVINLHWVAHFISPESLRALLALGKPVVWTLHDMRPFTGGCHYTAGCEAFVHQCTACPQLQLPFNHLPALSMQLSMEAVTEMPKITVVTPSRWLGFEAGRSRVFTGCRTEVIPNGIDLGVFKASDRRAARAKFGLRDDALVMIFGAFYLTEHRKGFDLLRSAIEQALQQPEIAQGVSEGRVVFAGYGRGDKELQKSGLPVMLLGEQRTPEEMAACFSAADLFICPTREDNLPNAVMESMACGVAVLATNVGGVPDMIADGEHGRLVPAENADALASALIEIIREPSKLQAWGAEGRTKCEQLYAQAVQARHYAALFRELLPLTTSPLIIDDDLPSTQALRDALQGAVALQRDHDAEQERVRSEREQAAVAKRNSPRAQLKRVEQELKERRAASVMSFLSPSVWRLKKQRDALRRQLKD